MKKFILSIILVGILSFIGFMLVGYIKDVMPSFQYIDQELLYRGDEETFAFILEDRIFEDVVLESTYEDKQILYLPLTFVREHINEHYFWDQEEKILTFTTLKEVVRVEPNRAYIKINNQQVEKTFPILIYEGDRVYIALDFVVDWAPLEYNFYVEPPRLFVERKDGVHKRAEVKNKKTYLREEPSNKSYIITDLQKGDKITIYEEVEEYFYVKSEKGWLGYIPKKDIENIRITSSEESIIEVLEKDYLPEYKINLVWHQVTNRQANSSIHRLLENTQGVNVLSPTWFFVKDESGDIGSYGDTAYVQWAHQNGYQVWALVDNQFSRSLTHEVLKSTAKRTHMIDQLIKYAIDLNLDGLNIDFENVGTQDGQAFVQFIRELAVEMYYHKLILSIDAYVPAPWTAHYNRKELSKVADYIAIMAYDEHWSTSPVSGSVASLPFVESGILNTLKEVPKEKVILGLPFYTRIWIEEEKDGEIKVSSRAYGMSYVERVLEENGVEIQWDEISKQYYGEYTIDGKRYRVWMEEERSIEEKLKLYENYELAGVAAWKLGLEKKSIWDVILKYVN